MSQDPTKARVTELLHQWCDDPPETGMDAIAELKDVLYPTKYERDEAEFESFWSQFPIMMEYTPEVAARTAWMAAKGHN
jgi:hypothetical protein